MSWKKINNNLNKRANASLKSNLVQENEDTLFLSSENDLGVVRNGGRRGSAYGPRALLSNFLKLANRDINKKIKILKVAGTLQLDFESMQEQSYQTIFSSINNQERLINLGGGHDHAYPFIKAIIDKFGSTTIINIDAHLDTRNDSLTHSGTPFRQLLNEYDKSIELIQLGIHDFANIEENYQGLDMQVYTMDKLEQSTKGFTLNDEFIKNLLKNAKFNNIVLSIDLDGIDGDQMRAVSAVNHHGIPMTFIRDFFKIYQREVSKVLLGIYEYNPIFDDLSTTDARKIASLLYKLLK